MKTIALAVENFDRHGGGMEAYAVALAEYLIGQGWEVHCYGLRWAGEPAGVMFHRLTMPGWWPKWLRIIGFAIRHRKAVQVRRFDIVLGFGNTVAMNVYQSHGGVHTAHLRRTLAAIPHPWLQRGAHLALALSPKHWARYWVDSAPRRLRPRPRLVAISTMVKQDMVAEYGFAADTVTVIPNGVDSARFNPANRRRLRAAARASLKLGADEVMLLFVAFDLRKKGMVPLLEAGARLAAQGARMRIVVAGAGPDRRLLRRIARLGLGERVVFLGRVAAMEQSYAAADVVVLPTYYDACSLATLEALACGVPVITSAGNGAADGIRDGENGFVIAHPPTVAKLTETLRMVLDPARRQAMERAVAQDCCCYSSRRGFGQLLTIFAEAPSLYG